MRECVTLGMAPMVLRYAAMVCGADVSEVMSGGRTARASRVRYVCVLLLREHCRPGATPSYPEIRDAVGYRSHSGARDAHMRAVRLRADDAVFRRQCALTLRRVFGAAGKPRRMEAHRSEAAA